MNKVSIEHEEVGTDSLALVHVEGGFCGEGTPAIATVDRDNGLVPQKSKINPRQKDYEGQATDSLPEVAIKVNGVSNVGKSGVFEGLRLEGKKPFGKGGVFEGGQLGPNTKWARLKTKRQLFPLGGPASTLKPSFSRAMSLNKRVGLGFSKKVVFLLGSKAREGLKSNWPKFLP